MEKLLARTAFTGGLAVVFLGIALLLIEADTGEKPLLLEYTISVLIFLTGVTTLIYVSRSGLGKGKS